MGSGCPNPTPRVSLKLSSTPTPDVGSLGLTGLPSPSQGSGPGAYRCFSGTVLQPEGVLLIQLLQLQLQLGILNLGLAELALAGGQHLGEGPLLHL